MIKQIGMPNVLPDVAIVFALFGLVTLIAIGAMWAARAPSRILWGALGAWVIVFGPIWLRIWLIVMTV